MSTSRNNEELRKREKREEVNKLISAAWTHGLCMREKKVKREFVTESECQEAETTLNSILKKAKQEDTGKYASLKRLSVFAKRGGKTAYFDEELRRSGFDHSDFSSRPSAWQRFNDLEEEKQKYLKNG